MSEYSAEGTDEVNPILWWMGWRVKATIAIITGLGVLLGYAVDAPFLLGTLGFLASPVVAFVAIRHVNGNYKSVLESFHSRAGEKAIDLVNLDEEDKEQSEKYPLYYGYGAKLFRKPKQKYSIATMIVTDYSVIIHDGNELDMVNLKMKINDSTEEIYFDQVSSVNYQDGEFWINRSDGHGNSWPSEREPDDALDDIQGRVRNYKRQATA